MRKFIDIVVENVRLDCKESGWTFLREMSGMISEKAPSSKKAARFIKHAKKDFKERYGKNWKKVLYATAWSIDENVDGVELVYEDAAPRVYGWWITDTGDLIEVHRFGHDVTAEEWLESHDRLDAVMKANYHHLNIVDFLVRKAGWIKLTNERSHLSLLFQQNSLTPKAARKACEMIQDCDGDVLLSIQNNGYKDTLFPDHETRKAANMVRANVGSPNFVF
jgi:hypothetical protein